MWLQIGKEQIKISEIIIHYIHYQPPLWYKRRRTMFGYSESTTKPQPVTDENFNNIPFSICQNFVPLIPGDKNSILIPEDIVKVKYFTFKCNVKKLQKYLNKKIMGDSKDVKTILYPSTKEVFRTIDLFGYYILFDEDTSLYTCKIDHFEENFYN